MPLQAHVHGCACHGTAGCQRPVGTQVDRGQLEAGDLAVALPHEPRRIATNASVERTGLSGGIREHDLVRVERQRVVARRADAQLLELHQPQARDGFQARRDVDGGEAGRHGGYHVLERGRRLAVIDRGTREVQPQPQVLRVDPFDGSYDIAAEDLPQAEANLDAVGLEAVEHAPLDLRVGIDGDRLDARVGDPRPEDAIDLHGHAERFAQHGAHALGHEVAEQGLAQHVEHRKQGQQDTQAHHDAAPAPTATAARRGGVRSVRGRGCACHRWGSAARSRIARREGRTVPAPCAGGADPRGPSCPHDHARSEAARWIGGRAVASRHALPRARHARAALPLRPLAATVPPPSRERMAGWCPPRSSKPLCPWATLGRRVRFPCSPANHLGVLARSIRAERRTRIARGHRVAASSRTSAHPIAQDGVGPGGGPGESRSPVGPQDGTIHRGLPSASAGVEGDSGCGQLAPRALDGLSPR